ncbi:hypothetical protein [Bacteriophage sp.]|nr:hypothetical protein [Bacteriophage sp.]
MARTFPQASLKDYERLHELRVIYQSEMQRAIWCITDDDKRKLAKDWQEKYPKSTYDELIKMAKDYKNRVAIANWDVQKFKSKSK